MLTTVITDAVLEPGTPTAIPGTTLQATDNDLIILLERVSHNQSWMLPTPPVKWRYNTAARPFIPYWEVYASVYRNSDGLAIIHIEETSE